MELSTLNRALREPNRVSGAHLTIDQARSSVICATLQNMPVVAGVNLKALTENALHSQMDSGAGAIRYVMGAIAFIITFGIVYNAARIAFAERSRDLASLRVIGFDDQGLASAIGSPSNDIPLHAPANGRILRVIQQSETSLPAGAPIMEIGNIANDLEVVVELLSTDAVQVSIGDPVIIDEWGGSKALSGTVTRVDPFGITQASALGVQEQRVNRVIAFVSPPEDYAGLDHGFRVETRIVVWEEEDTMIVPACALFRSGDSWAVFVVSNDTANLVPIEIGPNNGVTAQVKRGLSEGDLVILYPSSHLSEGMRVAERIIE